MRKLLAGLLAAGTVGTIGAAVVPAASAAPANRSNTQTVVLVCDNDQSYTGLSNGNGNWNPLHTTDGQIVQPLALNLTFHDPVSGQSFSFSVAKRKSNNPDVLHCNVSSPDGVLTGTAIGVVH
jgi:hypothetical protein